MNKKKKKKKHEEEENPCHRLVSTKDGNPLRLIVVFAPNACSMLFPMQSISLL